MTTHHGSHAGLYTRVDASTVTAGDLDAIIVPTVRTGEQLRPALRVAAELDCQVLCLSSRGSDPRQIIGIATDTAATATVVDTTDALPKLLPRLETTRFVDKHGFGRGTDLSGKRNLGLLICRAMGWNRILFLDDDIGHLDPAHLRAVAGLLGDYDAVGLDNSGFPDNSVVCHAHRETDGPQETFVSGGLLGVNTDRLVGFFPDIYNEDWFFLHFADRIARTGDAKQEPYDPFARPERAGDEELGDCLAEGLYWLRDEKLPLDTARDTDFWGDYLHGRRRLIAQVTHRLNTGWPGDRDLRDRMLASLAAASDKHTDGTTDGITAQLCVDFVHAWQDDLAAWRKHRTDVTDPGSIRKCLRRLEECHGPGTTTDWEATVHQTG